jgi:hypothetical protein
MTSPGASEGSERLPPSAISVTSCAVPSAFRMRALSTVVEAQAEALGRENC